ncbi:alpha/beta fold hydrolase [Ornithobacterium rhinotracheale]|uniref:alpha/beta fold hydrolase n=1 Tax=Ornithobacterium rhinotracheale TaxID=28251 RepID=UPI0040354B6A
MQIIRDFYQQEKEGLARHEIFYQLLVPNEKPKATFLIIHGMEEHSDRYLDFAKFMVEQGFAVMLYDHLGHGKTAKNTENLSFIMQDNPAAHLVEDAGAMTDFLHQKFPEIPHFVMGHSMGSFVLRCLLQKKSADFQGAIVMGTGARVFGTSLAKGFLAILNKIIPRYKSDLINVVFARMNNRFFKGEPLFHDLNWLSVNHQNRENYHQDPLCGEPFSVNGFYALLGVVDCATKAHWAKDISPELPMLFISGNDDPIGDFGKGVKKAATQAQAGGREVALKLYPKMRHEILNEEIKNQVYCDIENWISRHLA